MEDFFKAIMGILGIILLIAMLVGACSHIQLARKDDGYSKRSKEHFIERRFIP